MRDCAAAGKELIVLDRINPLGGKVEGGLLQPGFESFVGAYPLTTRYGRPPVNLPALPTRNSTLAASCMCCRCWAGNGRCSFPKQGCTG